MKPPTLGEPGEVRVTRRRLVRRLRWGERHARGQVGPRRKPRGLQLTRRPEGAAVRASAQETP